MTDPESMVRVGIVSSVDANTRRARVYFPDRGNMVSGWLYVVRQTNWMPQVNGKVLCLMMCGSETDGYILGVVG